MLSKVTTLVFLLIALSSDASPVIARGSFISLSVVKHSNRSGDRAAKFVNSDRARVKSFISSASNARLRRSDQDILATTDLPLGYFVSIGVGSPPTNYNLVVDIGSSNIWLGAVTPYKVSSTSTDTHEKFFIPYGNAFVSGTEYTDQVTLGDILAVQNQYIGDAQVGPNLDGLDGILGIGPADLTCGTLPTAPSTCIPTLTNTLFSEGLTASASVALSFEPTVNGSEANGEITFGGTDSSRYTGSLDFVPITSTEPMSNYVGINQTISYGSPAVLIQENLAGIIDSGTLLTYISSTAFQDYVAATGAVMDDEVGLLKISASQYDSLESLFFTIGEVSYEFTANAQLWPRSLNTQIGGTSDDIFLVIQDIGTAPGQDFAFISGLTWLERFYLVYDEGERQVGLATTQFTHATSN